MSDITDRVREQLEAGILPFRADCRALCDHAERLEEQLNEHQNWLSPEEWGEMLGETTAQWTEKLREREAEIKRLRTSRLPPDSSHL